MFFSSNTFSLLVVISLIEYDIKLLRVSVPILPSLKMNIRTLSNGSRSAPNSNITSRNWMKSILTPSLDCDTKYFL